MFQNLCDKINACLEQAERCREAAASEPDERVRQQFLYLEQQWQQVAESYQFIESLERLLLDRALPPDVEKLPKDFPQNRDQIPDLICLGAGERTCLTARSHS